MILRIDNDCAAIASGNLAPIAGSAADKSTIILIAGICKVINSLVDRNPIGLCNRKVILNDIECTTPVGRNGNASVGTDIDNIGIRRINNHRADAHGADIIGQRLPARAGVRSLPYTTRGGGDEKGIGVGRMKRNRGNAAGAVGRAEGLPIRPRDG